ncbi:MAG TPA: tripartite tricarboxylate transporter substrate binding protein [Quisquiliibacterium sp.]|nr:tripartite tricarboxylate transporter substrate binding protein [Quisquiliibacterium sp.]HQD81914.1 tripartite tricarboxylate transporter substrate binding protein [Quisquiliibacterium sp.]HQN13683.1 tripartite tricarboxylate transporter substrate binding protein [Quisquiliibacterium sp.]
MDRRAALRAGGALAASTLAAPAIAQAPKWPSREITLINPNAPGASTDLTARIVAQALEKRLNATVIVKNVVGGAGALGPSTLATSAPDGHTMGLVAISSHIAVPNMMDVKYNPWEAFDVIGQVAALRYGIGVPANSPFKTIDDLIATGKQRQVTYGSNNVTNVVAMFQLAKLTGAKLRWVVFSGGVEAVAQAVGGHVDAAIQTVAEIRPQVDGGKMRLLAAAGPQRWPYYPEVKTLRELGYEAVTNGPFGYAFPTGVEASIKQRMEAALADVMKDKSVTDQIAALGIEPVYRSGADYKAFLKKIEGELVPILQETGMAKKRT